MLEYKKQFKMLNFDYFSALKKKETADLKKLEERESELYNIKSELKVTKESLAEKNKQMTGKCHRASESGARNDWVHMSNFCYSFY